MPPAPQPSPPLHHLVLAGGRGTRLGADKGALDYHGRPQTRWALELVRPICPKVFVSVRAVQVREPLYRDLPLILDGSDEAAGPAAGLAAALRRLGDATVLGTAFRHADGTPEPLCAIFEPAVLPPIESAGGSHGASLRRVLAAGPAKLLALDDDEPLTSVNTPEDDARVRRRLAGAEP